jgi:hypothetical protein
MTCSDCSGLFVFLPRGVCVRCQEAREERFQAVRDWLVGRPDATMVDVTEALGVEEALLSLWIREGRLRAVLPSPDAARRERVQQQLRLRVAGHATGAFDRNAAPGMMRSKT